MNQRPISIALSFALVLVWIAARAPLAAQAALENDELVIVDAAQDGETVLELESFPTTSDPPDWQVRNDQGDLFVSVDGADALKLDATAPDGGFTLTGHLGEPRLGIGTQTPAGPFHMLLPGPAPLKLENSIAGVRWNVVNAANGVLSFNKKFTGGQEMTIRERLDTLGPTVEVDGSVRGTQFISTSSRTHKNDFRAVDSVAILERLVALPVTSWRYSSSSSGPRHIGPVAEDFQRLFALGDGRTISTVDADGVLMAAVQGAAQRLREQDEEIEELRRYNEALRARLAAVEEAVARR